MFRMFRNSDGTVQQVLPDTLIFFTDGMPTYSRLNAHVGHGAGRWPTTTPACRTRDRPVYNQLSWNRANRIAPRVRRRPGEADRRVRGLRRDGHRRTWLEQGAGYHLDELHARLHTDRAIERGLPPGTNLDERVLPTRDAYLEYDRATRHHLREEGQRQLDGRAVERQTSSTSSATTYNANNTASDLADDTAPATG